MNRKGFTLIELLAVIVILAIISVITVPMIMNVIDKAKIGALEDSAYGLVESANLYYAENVQNLTDKVTFDFKDGKQTSNSKLSYKGNVDNGKLILTTDGKTVVCVDDGTNYAYKELNNTKVVSGKGTCSYNGDTGNFDIVSSVDSLNQELNDLKKVGDAFASEIIEGKTALVAGMEVTGTMIDNSGKTIAASSITNDGSNIYYTIPSNGYYDTSSKISAPSNNVMKVAHYTAKFTTGSNGGWSVNLGAGSFGLSKIYGFVTAQPSPNCVSLNMWNTNTNGGSTSIYLQGSGTQPNTSVSMPIYVIGT